MRLQLPHAPRSWLLDPLIMTATATGLAIADGNGKFFNTPFTNATGQLALVLFPTIVLGWYVSARRFGVPHPSSRERAVLAIVRMFLVVASVVCILSVGFTIFNRSIPALVALSVILNLCLLVSARIGGNVHYNGHMTITGEWRCILVGASESVQVASEILRARKSFGLRPIGVVCVDETGRFVPSLQHENGTIGRPLCSIREEIKRMVLERSADQVVIVLPPCGSSWSADLLADLRELPASVRLLPSTTRTSATGSVDPCAELLEPLLGGSAIDGWRGLLKRSIDIVAAAGALVLTAPIMLVIAVAIRLDSPGPAIFRQTRVGAGGRLFAMLKFRSMVDGAEVKSAGDNISAGGKVVHKVRCDPRVTRVGRILRRTSLDELPQLLNILWGEMSIIGPRPELPFILQHYEPWQWARFTVPQGLTGWWQINGRSERMMHLHTEDDIYYIEHYSPWLDLWIVLKTVGTVISGRGAF